MPAAKPIVLTRAATNPNRAFKPEPLLIVGSIPASAIPAPTATALPAVPATFADLTAVQAYLAPLVAALKSSAYFD